MIHPSTRSFVLGAEDEPTCYRKEFIAKAAYKATISPTLWTFTADLTSSKPTRKYEPFLSHDHDVSTESPKPTRPVSTIEV